MEEKNKTDLVYLTSEGWWHADLTMFPYITNNFNLKVISIVKNKGKVQKTIELTSYEELENKLSFKNPFNIVFAIQLYLLLCFKFRNKQILYEFYENPYVDLILLLINPKRIVISWHDYIPHSGANKISYLLRKIYTMRFKRFRVHSKYQYLKFLENTNNEKKLICYTNLPLNNYGIPQEKFVLSKTYKKVFLFFGTINPYKNLKILIEAIEQLNEDILLIIAGQDFDNWDLNYAPLIKNNNKYSVNLRFVQDDEVADIFSYADYLVLPYSDTTQSGPLLIALNYNIPIIASDLEPFRMQIVENETGFFFENHNCISLQNVLKMTLNLSQTEYLKLKQNIEYRATNYKIEIKKSYEIFSELLVS